MRQDADRRRAKELFRQMSKKEKIRHIFRYYWMQMLITVVLLAVGVSFVTTVREGMAKRHYLYVALQAEYSDEIIPAVEQLAQQAQWPEEINFPTFANLRSGEGEGGIQLSLYLAADELDFIVCDKYTMRSLTEEATEGYAVFALEETRLGELVRFEQELFVLMLSDTGREEKVQQFAPALIGADS